MRKLLISQFHIMVSRTDFLIALSVTLGLNLFSYLHNLFSWAETGLGDAYTWHFLYAGNTSSRIWLVFSVLFAFIVALPFGFSYRQDKKTGLLALHIHRAGVRQRYYDAKLLISFLGSFLVVAVPFGINLILCYLTFPHNYYSPILYFQELTGEQVVRDTVFGAKPFADLFVNNLLLYNLLFLAFLSIFSGLMGVFSTALSFLIRKRILIFVPLLVILLAGTYFTGVIYNMENLTFFNVSLLDYVGTDAFYGQSLIFIGSFLLAVLGFILLARFRVVRREDLL